jgi:hypothetical protein
MSDLTPERVEWPDREAVSADDLAHERARAVENAPVYLLARIGADGFTCDGCDHAPRCQLAYDLYNTDGDCLASK